MTHDAPDHPADRRARRRRRRRADQLDRQRRRRNAGFPVQIDLDPRRRAAHRRHHLLHRNLAGAVAPSSAASARCWRSRPASATSTSRWRANCWRPAARSPTASSRPTARMLIASTSRFYAMDEKIAMGDGRFDSDRLIKVIKENAQGAPAHRHGRAGQAKRLDHQRGDARRHRRLRPAAAHRRAARSRDPRGRQGGRQQSARLPRRARRGARQSSRRPSSVDKKHNAAGHAANCSSTRSRASLPALAQADRARRRPPADRLSGRAPTRGFISIACGRSSKLDESGGARGQAAEGSRAASRGAHVVRGRGARGAGQDCAGAHAPHRPRGIARQGRAVLGARFPQARHRGNVPVLPRLSGAADPAAGRSARLARPRLFRHGDQLDLGQRLSALLDAREAAAAAPIRLSLRAGAGADRILARADRTRRRSSRPISRSRSPNARG